MQLLQIDIKQNMHYVQFIGYILGTVFFSLFFINIAHAGATVAWQDQFGTAGNDQGHGVATYSGGSYTVGTVYSALPGQQYEGSSDAFIRKYDTEGNVVWTRQFGTSAADGAIAVTVTPQRVYVAGYVDGTLQNLSSAGGRDAFLRAYSHNGTMVMNKQFGTDGNDQVRGIAYDNYHIYIVGATDSEFSGETTAGVQDVFVVKYHNGGTPIWSKQFGTSGNDQGQGVFVSASGIYVVGNTGGTFAGETNAGGSDGFISKLTIDGVPQWTQQIGTSGYDYVFDAVELGSNIYVVGDAEGALPGEIGSGDLDPFIQKYATADGTLVWTDQFGTSGFDEAFSVDADADGVYVAGFVEGALPGQVHLGGLDAYVRKYDENGSVYYTEQFGTAGSEDVLGMSVYDGVIHIGGSSDGTFAGETNAGGDDVYIVQVQQDTDNDTIYDSVDTDVLNYSTAFSDGDTTGTIITHGDQVLRVQDAPSSGDGIEIVADNSGGANPAVISECGIATSTLTAGDSLIITCGSVTLEIESGVVETTLIADDGRIANTVLSTGTEITFESDVATVTTPPTNTTDVVLTIGNEVTIVVPGSVDEIPTDHPVTIDDAAVTPAAVMLGENVTLTTLVTAPINETSTIANIVYSVDGGVFTAVPSDDGVYDSVSESGTISIGSFTQAGIHEVCVRGVDTLSSPSEEQCMLLAVYDPQGGYVTGGGQIESPAGAYVADGSLSGKAHFGFIAEYEVGAQIPTGNTQFRFNAGDLRFKSTSYEWLVVAGARAQYKGYGKIGKEDGYRFMLTAVDGDALGNSGQSDKLRMKIWNDQSGGVIYDNQLGDGDAANVTTSITHGSIVIHNQ